MYLITGGTSGLGRGIVEALLVVDSGNRAGPRRSAAPAPDAAHHRHPLGLTVAKEYARRRGSSVEAHIAERYGQTMTARQYGDHVAAWLTGPQASGVEFGVSHAGVNPLEEPRLQR